MTEKPQVADHYSAQYDQFAAGVHESVRRAAFGEDIGQNSWLTVDELERFGRMLELGPSSRLLDVACGSGGPALHLAQRTGCEIVGVELYNEAVESGNRLAAEAGSRSEHRSGRRTQVSRCPSRVAPWTRFSASTRSTIFPTPGMSSQTGLAC